MHGPADRAPVPPEHERREERGHEDGDHHCDADEPERVERF
jgi:hypothetical protein